jgi:predicted RNA-binding protein YlxR (DUF448 family)
MKKEMYKRYKMKKIPERMCVITREKYPKKELIRVVKNKEGEVFIDTTGKANGRGAYLKKDIEVIEKARKTKSLDRILEIEIPANIYEELIELIK